MSAKRSKAPTGVEPVQTPQVQSTSSLACDSDEVKRLQRVVVRPVEQRDMAPYRCHASEPHGARDAASCLLGFHPVLADVLEALADAVGLAWSSPGPDAPPRRRRLVRVVLVGVVVIALVMVAIATAAYLLTN
jgi:hypothetical protein